MDDKDLQYFINRKRSLEKRAIIGYILVGISFILWVPLGAATMGQSVPLLLTSFIGGGFIVISATRKFKELSHEFKSKYLVKEIEKIYPGCEYDPRKGFTSDEIYGAKILRRASRFYSEDYMKGIYEGVAFEAADVTLEDVHNNGKQTTTVTVFMGRVYKFQFNKKFRSNIIINQPSFFNHLFGWKRVKTESVEFNKELTVYSDDEYEAFYVLTPHLMEKLLELDRKYHDRICFSFINNRLYIAIDTRVDTFDLKMFRQFDNNILNEYRDQLNDIKDFIHHLNLDRKLFEE